jgi:polyphosphate kinase
MPETIAPLEKTPSTKINLDDPKLYVNRELSLLAFQWRVLEEAQDPTNPLLERVKFLSIVGSNLDEFFMVRVAGLKKQIDANVPDIPPDGLTPAEQLAAIRKEAQRLMAEARRCLQTDLMPALQRAGIHLLDYNQLDERQIVSAKSYFDEVVFPVLTPLAFDPGHPFPHISNLSLNLAAVIRSADGQEHFARIKVPSTLPRLVPLKRSSGGVRKDGTVPYNHYFVWLEQVIAANLEALFPGMQIVEAYPFRVTRDADNEIQELEAADLLESMEESVRQRRFGSVVRVTVTNSMPAHVRDILIENLEMDRNDIYVMDLPLGLSSLIQLHGVDRRDLKDIPFIPATPPALKGDGDGNIFSIIRREDFLVHHPYESFSPVIDFLRTAAYDQDVLAIKMTLYRVGRNSPVVQTLLEAVERGKQVAVLVELKARFDEESNIGWAKKLESAGVHVIYGLLGLKTHSKVALIIRKEGEGIRRYLHLGTGNYNPITANLYEDLGMFTCDEQIGMDATDLFNFLTGYSNKKDYRKLLVAPVNLRSRLEGLIQREIDLHKKEGGGRLIFKMNALVDQSIIQALYKASIAGVKVDLLARGICCLRPGLPEISENIRVTSILGRFLEHSRIYYFRNGGQEEIYLGSADLMPRNINRRVEVLFPVSSPPLVQYLHEEVLETYLADNVKARWMSADGNYVRRGRSNKEPRVNAQEWLIQRHHRTKTR